MTPYYQDDLVTIYHGDCREWITQPWRDATDVLVTDPPYGIDLQYHDDRSWIRRPITPIVGDDRDGDVGQTVLDAWAGRPTVTFASPMRPWAGQWRQFLVWDKGPAVGGGGDPATCWKQSWELIQVRATGSLRGARDTAVLRFHIGPDNAAEHPAAKPVSLMAYLIWKVFPGTILDPFMGSGTTLVAAKSLGRKSIGIEIEERYCEIAARRCSQEVLGLVTA